MTRKPAKKWRSHPLDRIALSLMLGLSVLIGILIGLGDHTVPKVRDFSWNKRQVGVEDRAFTLTFNRPMNWEQVPEHLTLDPPMAGKVSWSGRRMAYTLSEPMIYGQSFQLSLDQVTEQIRGSSRQPKPMHPFQAQFKSRDRAFAYIGATADESGRLILTNLSTEKQTILTPPELEVFDFQPFPYGDRILIAATERQEDPNVPFNPKLFTVATGLDVSPAGDITSDPAVVGTLKPILDDDQYQILKFDLSDDGEKVVVQRAFRSETGAIGQVTLWQAPIDGPATQVETESGGDFQIAPDGQTLVMAQGQGLGLIPLDQVDDQSPLDFLPEFGALLGFSQDGTTAATIKFNSDFTRSLFMVNIQGQQKELLRIRGGILSAAFSPDKKQIYCLLTRVQESAEEYLETPYLAKVDLDTLKLTSILDFVEQPDTSMSLSPDGRSLLFDQAIERPVSASAAQDSTALDVSYTDNSIWMLPIDNPAAIENPQPVKIAGGSSPKWLP